MRLPGAPPRGRIAVRWSRFAATTGASRSGANSRDHLPPHFHAEKTHEWEVRVFFLSEGDDVFQVVYSKRKGRPREAELKEIRRMAAEHREELYAQWEIAVDVKAPGPER